jgi:hypothetical protein
MITFDEVMKSLFYNNLAWYVDMFGKVKSNKTTLFADRNNCTSQSQVEKWLCINDLMNLAKYFNHDWVPDWTNSSEKKFTIVLTNVQELKFEAVEVSETIFGFVFFKSAESTLEAIDILGVRKLNLIFLK